MMDNLSANDGWIKAAVEQRRRTQAAEAQVEALRKALERINRRASPDGSRTFDDTISALDWITDEARAALSVPAEEHRTVLVGRTLDAMLAEESSSNRDEAISLEQLDLERRIARIIEPKGFEASDDLSGLEQAQRQILRRQAGVKAAKILDLPELRKAIEVLNLRADLAAPAEARGSQPAEGHD